jgi:hypothetical protein
VVEPDPPQAAIVAAQSTALRPEEIRIGSLSAPAGEDPSGGGVIAPRH